MTGRGLRGGRLNVEKSIKRLDFLQGERSTTPSPSCPGGEIELPCRGEHNRPALAEAVVDLLTKMPGYGLQNNFSVFKYLFVFESYDANALLSQIRLPLIIVFPPSRIVVYLPIQLNGKFLSRAIKIDDVRPAAMLPSKLPASELTSLQIPPERTFRARCVIAQRTTDDFEPLLAVDFLDPSWHFGSRYADCSEVEFQFPLLDRRGLRGGRLKTSKTVRIASIFCKVGDQPPLLSRRGIFVVSTPAR